MSKALFCGRSWISICLVFVCVLASGCRAPVTHSKEPAKSAVVVPDMEILYTTDNPPRWQIRVLRLPSGKTDVLLDSRKMSKQLGSLIGTSVFSPTGQYVLVGCDELSDLWILDRRTKAVRRLTTDAQGYSDLHWSSDGRYVSAHGLGGWTTPEIPPTQAVACRDTLYVWDTRSGHRTRVVGRGELDSSARWERWMPNGDRLLALANDYHLYLWNASTGSKRLVATDAQDFGWTRDGKRLFFSTGKIWYAPSAGTPVTAATGPLLANLEKDLATHYPSPDGSRSLTWSDDEVKGMYKTRISVSNEHTGKRTEVQLDGYVEPIGWSQDGRTIVLSKGQLKVVDSEERPPRILAVSTDTGLIRDLGTLPTSAALGTPRYWDWRLVKGMSPRHRITP